jgi:precorrin-6B methylase 1
MSDKALEAKFVDQASVVIGEARALELLKACWELPNIRDAAEVARLAS